MIKSLQVKFVCILMAIVMTMLLVILGLLYHSTVVNLEDSSIAALRSAMAGQTRPGRPGFGDQPCFILKEGLEGQVLVLENEYFDLTVDKIVEDIYLQAKQQDVQIGILEQYSLRFYREPGIFGDRYAFADISGERQTLRDLLTACILGMVGGSAGFLAISMLLAKWAVRPVEDAWEQQRQFVADASHELKTPLTVILTNAEMLQSPEYSNAEKHQFTDSILDVSRQMRHLVEGLLQLARSDRGAQKLEHRELDLSDLIENALLPFEPVYFERGLVLETQIEPALRIKGDQTALRQVVDILLDTGQKYGTPGGPALLTLNRQGKKLHLQFFTPGTPLTAQQCQDIFKRFYRLDQARTSSGSYGLGLSIAYNVITAHDGRIWAEGQQDGNVFHVLLPEA